MKANHHNTDWIEDYGFILVAFAHMTDWNLADSELHVISEKLQLMLSNTKKEFTHDDIAQKIVSILNRYDALKDLGGDEIMKNLLISCESLKKEHWFDNLSASVILQFLAEIAEADHRIEKTEIQLLENLSNVFGVNPPRI